MRQINNSAPIKVCVVAKFLLLRIQEFVPDSRCCSRSEIISCRLTQQQRTGLPKTAQAQREEILLASTANFDNLRRHSDEECRTY
jgi:hypothetical protein